MAIISSNGPDRPAFTTPEWERLRNATDDGELTGDEARATIVRDRAYLNTNGHYLGTALDLVVGEVLGVHVTEEARGVIAGALAETKIEGGFIRSIPGASDVDVIRGADGALSVAMNVKVPFIDRNLQPTEDWNPPKVVAGGSINERAKTITIFVYASADSLEDWGSAADLAAKNSRDLSVPIDPPAKRDAEYKIFVIDANVAGTSFGTILARGSLKT